MPDKQALEDLRTVAALTAGRRILRAVLAMSNFIGPSYAAGDALATAYNEGLRAVGLNLAGLMNEAEPGLLLKIMLEDNK